jgi:hypothetical protein
MPGIEYLPLTKAEIQQSPQSLVSVESPPDRAGAALPKFRESAQLRPTNRSPFAMHLPVSNHIVVWTLATLVAFGTLSALIGAVLAIAANGAGVPLEYLKNSPFSSYFVPGLILGVVVGGTQLAAAIALLAKRGIALLLSAIAGFGMLIWIFAELAMIQQFSWPQAAYFILGGLELFLVLALLGMIPAIVDPLRDSHATQSTASTIRG